MQTKGAAWVVVQAGAKHFTTLVGGQAAIVAPMTSKAL